MTHRSGAGGRPGVASPIEIEDVVLAAWLAGIGWAVSALAGGRPVEWLTGGDVPGGVWVVAALLVFLLVTRGPEDEDLDTAIRRRVLLVGPAYPLLSIYALVGSQLRKWRAAAGRKEGAALSGSTGAGGPADTWPGPLVQRAWRRTAALPVALVGDAMFRGDLDTVLPAAGELADPSAVLHLLMVAAGFVFLVVGPRVAAGATLAPWPWVARFGLAIAAAWTGGQIVGEF